MKHPAEEIYIYCKLDVIRYFGYFIQKKILTTKLMK